MSLSEQTIKIVKATAPVLAEHGAVITTTMYRNMFARHPQIKEVFDISHNIPIKGAKFGHQPLALAQAVLAYAQNVDNLDALASAVKRIAEKHVAVNVKPEQYAIVGTELIGALKEVLGDAANEDIVKAWTEAYTFLANIFISVEKNIAETRAAEPLGWKEWKRFKITRMVEEAEYIASFYLSPEDGSGVPKWIPGQYICIQANIPNYGIVQRNYTLSCPPNNKEFRITVRHHTELPAGIVSTWLHSHAEGTVVNVSVPCGEYILTPEVKQSKSITFLALGIGITPVRVLAEDALENTSAVVSVFHGVRSETNAIFQKDFESLKSKYPDRFSYQVFTKTGLSARAFNWEFIQTIVPKETHIFMTGVTEWLSEVGKGLMKMGVPLTHIHYETFGPTLDLQEVMT